MEKQVLFMLMNLIPMMASAEVVEIDGIYFNVIPKGGVVEVVKHPEKYYGDVVIPESITFKGKEYVVNSIGEYAFYECYSLTSVTIPHSISSIGKGAFFRNPELTSVHIFDIAAWCNISFASNPLSYAHHLYLNNEEVKNLIIPDNVASIAKNAFFGFTGLVSVDIGNSVTSIEENAFYGCSGLTAVTIGDSVLSIGDWSFCNCSNLTTVLLGNSVTSLGKAVFYDCLC